MAISLASLNRRNSPRCRSARSTARLAGARRRSPAAVTRRCCLRLRMASACSRRSIGRWLHLMKSWRPWLYSQPRSTDLRAYGIDSLDWLESLIWRKVCADNHWDNISQPDYGKGYGAADVVWDQYFNCIEYLRDHKRMMILQLAHSEIKTYKSPILMYDQHQIKLHKNAAAKVREHSDIIGYTGYRVSVKEVKGGSVRPSRASASASTFCTCKSARRRFQELVFIAGDD